MKDYDVTICATYRAKQTVRITMPEQSSENKITEAALAIIDPDGFTNTLVATRSKVKEVRKK